MIYYDISVIDLRIWNQKLTSFITMKPNQQQLRDKKQKLTKY